MYIYERQILLKHQHQQPEQETYNICEIILYIQIIIYLQYQKAKAMC